MSNSVALTLARGLARIRRGEKEAIALCGALLPAQSGCAFRLIRDGLVELDLAAAKSVGEFERALVEAYGAGGYASDIVGRRPSPSRFVEVCATWFSGSGGRREEALAGYWLADAYLRGVTFDESLALTDFLAGTKVLPPSTLLANVRRYPTGGISEKQALILPPLLRALSAECGWCSSFLVAGKLAHTGGTRDKLGVLPGLRLSSMRALRKWDQTRFPVRYFSAGSDFCPRDATMYRMRSETGTVADYGLMAASIMSKHISAPADVVVLDVLYGTSAFLITKECAVEFSEWCREIGSQRGLSTRPIIRASRQMLGRAVGSSTEVLEAIEILRGERNYCSAVAEIEVATGFISEFVTQTGRKSFPVRRRIDELIGSGEAFKSLCDLWLDHGIDEDFLDAVHESPGRALLEGLHTLVERAPESGVIRWRAIDLADIANNCINRHRKAQEGALAVRRGGLEILVEDGDHVTRGMPVVICYYEAHEGRRFDLRKTFEICPAGGQWAGVA